MRMIHCADLHLDARMTANLTKEQAHMRKAELLHTFTRMVAYAVENDVQAILIAGDLFDTNRVSATARNVVREAIASNPEIAFYYLRGNHDATDVLEKDAPENLHFFSEQWTSYVLNPQTGANIVLTGAELIDRNADMLCASLVLSADCVNIVTLHGQESISSAKEKAEVIPLAKLRGKGIDYLALGHVHAYACKQLDARGRYCYCGCLEGRGFDECGQHGFVLLDIDEKEKTVADTFVPFALRTLHTIPVDVSDCMTSPQMLVRIREVLTGDRGASAADGQTLADETVYASGRPEGKDLLKIVLTGAVDVDCEMDLAFLKRQLASDYFFVKLADGTTLRFDPKQYALDASLKGEFVRTVLADEALADEEKAAVIQCGVRALAGEL